MSEKPKKPIETSRLVADANHEVVTVRGGEDGFMRRPCQDCPWRKDSVGIFPAEAFRISAHTSYDMNDHQFGCHSSGTKSPKICAGFLLKGAKHNLAVRLSLFQGKFDLDRVSDGGTLFSIATSLWQLPMVCLQRTHAYNSAETIRGAGRLPCSPTT